VAILFYLFAHVADTALVNVSPEAYNRVIGTYRTPFVGVLEIGLSVIVIFHALNSLRVILFDFWSQGVARQRQIYLDVSHLDPAVIDAKLPDITEFARTYLGVEPKKKGVPIQPTAHYAIGGIPANIHGEVVADPEGNVVPGLYAAGECACVSVHGANRLGTNSLLDIVVFGRRAGIGAAEHARGARVRRAARRPRRRRAAGARGAGQPSARRAGRLDPRGPPVLDGRPSRRLPHRRAPQGDGGAAREPAAAL
jgi:FAD binding domain/Succinate dehydrogenase/Fumarate reductase transmembrane subunit